MDAERIDDGLRGVGGGRNSNTLRAAVLRHDQAYTIRLRFDLGGSTGFGFGQEQRTQFNQHNRFVFTKYRRKKKTKRESNV